MRHRIPARVGIMGTRWERALDRFQAEGLSDEAFWEAVRVSVDWYYHDQYGGSTLEWLKAPAPGDGETDRLKALFLEAMTGGHAGGGRRSEVVGELAGIFERKSELMRRACTP